MRFNSEAERLAHPQAGLISKIMWDGEFFKVLSSTQLMLMQPDSLQNMARVIETMQTMHLLDDRRNAAICILYAHPYAIEMLIENATAFNLSPKDLLYIALTYQR